MLSKDELEQKVDHKVQGYKAMLAMAIGCSRRVVDGRQYYDQLWTEIVMGTLFE